MPKMLVWAAGVLLSAGVTTITTPAAQAQSASVQRCMDRLGAEHQAWRASQGLDTEVGVSMDQIGEWERICSAQRTRRSTTPQPRRTATQSEAAAQRAAQSVIAAATPPVSPWVPSPAQQQCILGKMTAYVRDRDLNGLDSRIPETKSAEFRAQCGEPQAAQGQTASLSGAAAAASTQGAATIRADSSFNGGCQHYVLDRREYFPISRPRPCPAGVSVRIPTAQDAASGRSVTMTIAPPGAPRAVIEFKGTSQLLGFGNSSRTWGDNAQLTIRSVNGKPHEGSCGVGFNRSGAAAQPQAIMSCSANAPRPGNSGFGGFDMQFSFNLDDAQTWVANQSPVSAWQAAVIAMFDALDPNRPLALSGDNISGRSATAPSPVLFGLRIGDRWPASVPACAARVRTPGYPCLGTAGQNQAVKPAFGDTPYRTLQIVPSATQIETEFPGLRALADPGAMLIMAFVDQRNILTGIGLQFMTGSNADMVAVSHVLDRRFGPEKRMLTKRITNAATGGFTAASYRIWERPNMTVRFGKSELAPDSALAVTQIFTPQFAREVFGEAASETGAPPVATRSPTGLPQGRMTDAGPVVIVDETNPYIRQARISMQAREKCELSVRGRVWEDDETQRIVQECTDREIRRAKR